jgi:hypothetical protein
MPIPALIVGGEVVMRKKKFNLHVTFEVTSLFTRPRAREIGLRRFRHICLQHQYITPAVLDEIYIKMKVKLSRIQWYNFYNLNFNMLTIYLPLALA